MDPDRHCLETLYEAMRERDFAAIRTCYHPQAHFTDEVFDLQGDAVPAMWQMLLSRGKDMTFTVDLSGAPERTRWEPVYTFSGTGRPVHNIIHSSFEYLDGQIVRQIDRFDFWRWTRMALGPAGLLLGWTPMMRKKVRTQANARLAAFLTEHPEFTTERRTGAPPFS